MAFTEVGRRQVVYRDDISRMSGRRNIVRRAVLPGERRLGSPEAKRAYFEGRLVTLGNFQPEHEKFLRRKAALKVNWRDKKVTPDFQGESIRHKNG